jgi:hypothetical protein
MESFFRDLPLFADHSSSLFGRLALTCAADLPIPHLRPFLSNFLQVKHSLTVQSAIQIALVRDPSLLSAIIEVADTPSGQFALGVALGSLSCQALPPELFLRISGLFLSGRIPILSDAFESFGAYALRNVIKDSLTAGPNELSPSVLFAAIEAAIPHFRDQLLSTVSESLGARPIQSVTLQLFFDLFSDEQMKLVAKSIVTGATLKALHIFCERATSVYLKQIVFRMFCGGWIAKTELPSSMVSHIFTFFKPVVSVCLEPFFLQRLLSLGFAEQGQSLVTQLLNQLSELSPLIATVKAVFDIFATRQKSKIPHLIKNFGHVPGDIITALYLIGVSKSSGRSPVENSLSFFDYPGFP